MAEAADAASLDTSSGNTSSAGSSSGGVSSWSLQGVWAFLESCFNCGDVQSRLEGDIETIREFLENEDSKLELVWNRFDADKGGEIDHAEFDRVLFACFRYFTSKLDPDEAPLSRTELQPFIETLNSDLHKMIDPNGDGVLSFEEFLEFGKYLRAEYQKMDNYLTQNQSAGGKVMRKTQVMKEFEEKFQTIAMKDTLSRSGHEGSTAGSETSAAKLKSTDSATLSATDASVRTETKSDPRYPGRSQFKTVDSVSQLTPVAGGSDGYRRMESQSAVSDPVMPKSAVKVGPSLEMNQLVFTGKQTGVDVAEFDGDGDEDTPEPLTAAEKEARRAAMMGGAQLVPSVDSYVSTVSTVESAASGTSGESVHPPPAIDEEPETQGIHQFRENSDDDDSDAALDAILDEAAQEIVSETDLMSEQDIHTDPEMSASPHSRDL